MTNILYNLAAEGVPVGMFSLEMSKEQLLERTLLACPKSMRPICAEASS